MNSNVLAFTDNNKYGDDIILLHLSTVFLGNSLRPYFARINRSCRIRDVTALDEHTFDNSSELHGKHSCT